MASSKTHSMVTLRLYRNLLRAAKPFTAPSPNARVLNCLLIRTGADDHITDWKAFVTATPNKEQAEDLSQGYYIGDNNNATKNCANKVEVIPPNRTHKRLFRQLLREVICGGDQEGIAKSTWPSLVNPTILWNIIRREFRNGPLSLSVYFDATTRKQVAFRALRELNKKLCFLDHLEKSSPRPLAHQAARHVSPLPFTSECLRPGTFLLAHPNMTGESFFSKAVICILEHDDKSQQPEESKEEDRSTKRNINLPGLQTYGLIVNRASVHTDTGRNRTLRESFEQHMLPGRLAEVFGDSVVREGGPVHVALQMLHSLPTPSTTGAVEGSHDPISIGGRVIPMVPNGDDTNPAVNSERSVYYQGEIFKAMSAVEDGRMDHDDVAFFVGASTWSIGQLRREIAEGFWIPCRAPPEIALTGICEHDGYSNDTTKRPLADLWLSMMSACGEDEAKLAHLYYHVDEPNEYDLPCDMFEKENAEDF